MKNRDQDKPMRWRPKVTLWQLFAVLTLAAVVVWLWPKVGLELDHKPGAGSRAAIVWQGESTVELWNTFPPPPVFGFSSEVVVDENGVSGIRMRLTQPND